MKRNLIAPVLFITLFGSSVLQGQGPGSRDEANVLALVQQLKARQVQIADNQAKIDAKLTDLEEAIRTARIFVGRTGGPHKPPPPHK
jgi:hypothetical protein